jgi:limonene-1,2-epoxide hydrolase
MGQEQEKAVQEMLRLLDAEVIADNLEKVGGYLADDCTYQPVVPLATVHKGRDAIVDELRLHSSRYKNCVCDVESIASTDRTVFTERTDTVTMLGDGKKVVVQVVGVFEFDDDNRINAWREYWDNAAVAQQIGVPVESIPVVAAAFEPQRA